MPRTWSYRKRDYELAKPQTRGPSPSLIALLFLYALMCSALISGMAFAMTHRIPVNDPQAVMAPVPHHAASYQDPKDD